MHREPPNRSGIVGLRSRGRNKAPLGMVVQRQQSGESDSLSALNASERGCPFSGAATSIGGHVRGGADSQKDKGRNGGTNERKRAGDGCRGRCEREGERWMMCAYTGRSRLVCQASTTLCAVCESEADMSMFHHFRFATTLHYCVCTLPQALWDIRDLLYANPVDGTALCSCCTSA